MYRQPKLPFFNLLKYSNFFNLYENSHLVIPSMYQVLKFHVCSLQYKLCKVKKVSVGPKGVPFLVTSDGRTIRYPDPLVKVNDSILYDLEKGKMKDFIKFDSGEDHCLAPKHLETTVFHIFIGGFHTCCRTYCFRIHLIEGWNESFFHWSLNQTSWLCIT